jgi:hypothetical protein
VVQIEQDFAMCAECFPNLICRPIAAQFMANNVIALFAFEENEDSVAIVTEKHYLLVPPDALSVDELKAYRTREEPA